MHGTIYRTTLLGMRLVAEFPDDFGGEGTDRDTVDVCCDLYPRGEGKAERSYRRLCDFLVRTCMDDLVNRHGSLLSLSARPMSERAVARNRTFGLAAQSANAPRKRVGRSPIEGGGDRPYTRNVMTTEVGFLMTSARFFRVASHVFVMQPQ